MVPRGALQYLPIQQRRSWLRILPFPVLVLYLVLMGLVVAIPRAASASGRAVAGLALQERFCEFVIEVN